MTETCPHCGTSTCGTGREELSMRTHRCYAWQIAQLTEQLAAATAANQKLRTDVAAWIERMRLAGGAMGPRTDCLLLSVEKLNELAKILEMEASDDA